MKKTKSNPRVINHRHLRALAPVVLSHAKGGGIGTAPTLKNVVPCVTVKNIIPCVTLRGANPCGN